MPRTSHWLAALVACCARAALAAPADAPASELELRLAELRRPEPVAGEAIVVKSLRFASGPGGIELESGSLWPLTRRRPRRRMGLRRPRPAPARAARRDRSRPARPVHRRAHVRRGLHFRGVRDRPRRRRRRRWRAGRRRRPTPTPSGERSKRPRAGERAPSAACSRSKATCSRTPWATGSSTVSSRRGSKARRSGVSSTSSTPRRPSRSRSASSTRSTSRPGRNGRSSARSGASSARGDSWASGSRISGSSTTGSRRRSPARTAAAAPGPPRSSRRTTRSRSRSTTAESRSRGGCRSTW